MSKRGGNCARKLNIWPHKKRPRLFRNGRRNAEGFVTRNPDTIYLITSTTAFETARRGFGERGVRDACRHLAGVIVHEEWHLRHGGDEESAYLAQLTALTALGADSGTLSAVRRSMQFVVDREKARRSKLLLASR